MFRLLQIEGRFILKQPTNQIKLYQYNAQYVVNLGQFKLVPGPRAFNAR